MLINQLVFLTLSLINPALSASNNRQRPFLVEKFGDSIPFDLQPRLIRTSENEEPKWLNPLDIVDLRINNIKFMDVTDEGDVNSLKNNQLKIQDFQIPDRIKYNDEVNKYIPKLDISEMTHFLTKFTSFPNRYYNGDNGKASSNWLYDNLNDIIKQNDRRDISIKKVSHRFKQNSIVITVKGSQETDETVIIGSHQDSVNQWLPWFGKAPGADDDGSGTTSVHEAFRVLINGKFKPQRNVEFHFYAGEEGGLLGSQDIARSYAEQKRNIVAMMHFDMTGYFGRKEQIAVVTDHTDPELSQFLKKLISAYSELPQVESQCGYGCSDHASWNKYGFRSAFPIEDPNIEVNPNIHSPKDKVETISFHHVKEFSKLVIGFAIELSHI